MTPFHSDILPASLLWLRAYVGRAIRDAELGARTVRVMAALPEAVRGELMNDPAFALVELGGGRGGWQHALAGPTGLNRPGRTVVLRLGRLRGPADYACYIIAHELAHAYLRNGGRWPGDDPESAADALAHEWGFPRPG